MPPKNNDKSSQPQDTKSTTAKKKATTFCKLEDGEWYCYKMDGGQARQCGGPFETREECEANACNG